jgi:hypothetical protein
VAEGSETRIEFELRRGTTLEVRLAAGTKPWAAVEHVVLLDEDIANELDRLDPLPVRFADVNHRAPGVDPGWQRGVDMPAGGPAVVRGLAPGRYRLYDARRALAFEPAVIEVGNGPTESVTVRWRTR